MKLAVYKKMIQENKKNKEGLLIIIGGQMSARHSFTPTRRGFSLIEVLVTLMVLSIGITAIAALMAGNIRTTVNAKNQIIASSLAQEGVELVKNFKENEVATLDGLVAGNYFEYRINQAGIDSDPNKILYLNSGFYTHNSAGTPTKFFRSASLVITGSKATSPSTREIVVTTMVSWNGVDVPAVCNVGNKCVSVQAVIPDVE